MTMIMITNRIMMTTVMMINITMFLIMLVMVMVLFVDYHTCECHVKTSALKKTLKN